MKLTPAKTAAIVGGVGIGAGLAYFLDPKRGSRRRERARRTAARAGGQVRDVAGRARDLASSAGSFFLQKPVSDEVLEDRVRARIARISTHPDAINVRAHDGCVRLSGDVLAEEAPSVIHQVSETRGVDRLEDRLNVHRSAKDVSALEKPASRPAEIMRRNWPPALRVLVGATGGTLAAYGLSHRRLLTGRAASAVGLGLLAEGVANERIRKAIQTARRVA